jgi:hypothetical protein
LLIQHVSSAWAIGAFAAAMAAAAVMCIAVPWLKDGEPAAGAAAGPAAAQSGAATSS